jgi:predicted nucleic acid-binding protein
MNTPHVVLDASVIARVFLPDETSAAIDHVIRSIQVKIAPSILYFEMMSLLARAYRNNRLSLDQVNAALTSWTLFLDNKALIIKQETEYTGAALRLSCQLKHPFYDCCYLALAQLYNCPLITADKQLYNRGKEAYANIILVN